jgi:hypothetical protein
MYQHWGFGPEGSVFVKSFSLYILIQKRFISAHCECLTSVQIQYVLQVESYICLYFDTCSLEFKGHTDKMGVLATSVLALSGIISAGLFASAGI